MGGPTLLSIYVGQREPVNRQGDDGVCVNGEMALMRPLVRVETGLPNHSLEQLNVFLTRVAHVSPIHWYVSPTPKLLAT